MKAVWFLVLSAFLCVPLWSFSPAREPVPARIVFIGDSITDGNTYPLLIRQALLEAGKNAPLCTNAGVASDTAKDVRKRLDRDVLPYSPTLVALSIGVNDAMRKVKPEDYEADVAAVLDRLKAAKINVVVMTTTILGPKNAEAEKRLDTFNAILRRLAEKHGFRVAEVNRLMQDARKAGKEVLEPDQVHINYPGYELMARAVLDALGHKDVALPKELKLEVMPGVIREWKMRAVGAKEPPLDEKSIAALKPDETWKTYALPEKEPLAHWWMDHQRRIGFGVSLDKQVGKGKGYLGLAVLDARAVKDVYFNTGAQLNTIWLNGNRIYKNESWTGWHAGKERVPGRLNAGRNTVVIEVAGTAFFLSVTDNNWW